MKKFCLYPTISCLGIFGPLMSQNKVHFSHQTPVYSPKYPTTHTHVTLHFSIKKIVAGYNQSKLSRQVSPRVATTGYEQLFLLESGQNIKNDIIKMTQLRIGSSSIYKRREDSVTTSSTQNTLDVIISDGIHTSNFLKFLKTYQNLARSSTCLSKPISP